MIRARVTKLNYEKIQARFGPKSTRQMGFELQTMPKDEKAADRRVRPQRSVATRCEVTRRVVIRTWLHARTPRIGSDDMPRGA